jgi:LacI family transcriptional regulator
MTVKTARVVLLVAPSAGYDRDLLRGIGRYASLHGPWVFHIAGDYGGVPLPRKEAMNMPTIGAERATKGHSRLSLADLKRWGATGIIGRIQSPEIIEQVMKLGVSVIAMDRTAQQTAPGNPLAEVSEISPDSHKVGRLGAEHFLDRGFQRFAFCGYAGRFWSQRRQQGFCERLHEACFSCNVYEPPPHRSPQSWNRELTFVRNWLRALPKPVGVMACNDTRGLQILEACLLSDIRVPDDVAVLGVDNDRLSCDLSNPPLSSMALNAEMSGYQAAELLDGLMSGQERLSRQIVVEPLGVVARRSTDVIAVEDPHVGAVLKFIRENARWPIAVDDAVAQGKLARRSLEIRFRELLGRSIGEEIQRTRLSLTKQFLSETSLPMWKIAEASGFNSLTYLDRIFRREVGMTMRHYRRQYRSP